MKLELVTAPTAYPVTLAEIKDHMNYALTDKDDFILGLIAAATAKAEGYLRRRLLGQTWKLYLGGWPDSGEIRLPFGMLRSVTSVVYTESDGTANTWTASDYIVDASGEPGRIMPVYGEPWPSFTPYPANPICITFVCGFYGPADEWAASTAYAANAYAVPSAVNGLVYQCTTAGTSASTEPTWGTTIGGTTADGTAVWTCAGRAVPYEIAAALKLIVTDLFENRETVLANMTYSKLNTVEALLFPSIFWWGCP